MRRNICFGGLDPWGYHFTSIVLHSLNAWLLFELTRSLLRRAIPRAALADPGWLTISSAMAALLFAVHPLRVEAVAWVSCQPYLPAVGFSLLTVLAYLRMVDCEGPRRLVWLAIVTCLFALALLSKAVAVPIPFALLVLDVYPLRRLGGEAGWRRLWVLLWEKIPLVALSFLFMVIAVFAKSHSHSLTSTSPVDIPARIALASFATWFYLLKSILPTGLSATYPARWVVNLGSPMFCAGVVGMVLVTGAIVGLRRRLPGLTATWFASLICLAPNSGLIRISNQVTADRYSYLASACWVVILAYLFNCLARPSVAPVVRSRLFPSAMVLVLAVLMSATWHQCRTWRDLKSLWANALDQSSGGDAAAHNNLGLVLAEQGDTDEANRHFREALRLEPLYYAPYSNLGLVAADEGRWWDALAMQKKAVELDPADPVPHANLGLALAALGKSQEAIEQYHEALRIDPDSSQVYNNLGLALGDRSEWAKALEIFQRARVIDEVLVRDLPDDPAFHSGLASSLNNLGMAQRAMGRRLDALGVFSEAIVHQRFAVQRCPRVLTYRRFLCNHYLNLSQVSRELGRPGEAATAAEECGRLATGDPGRLYEAACELAQCARLLISQPLEDRAFLALKRAIDSGFGDRELAEIDPRLDALRGRKDFDALIRRISRPPDGRTPRTGSDQARRGDVPDSNLVRSTEWTGTSATPGRLHAALITRGP